MRLRSFFAVLATFAAVLTAASTPVPAEAATGYKTFFHHLDRAWAVGEIELYRPMEFRDGRVLAFPAKMVDQTFGKKGKVSSLLIVDELRTEADRPHFAASRPIYAPVGVLPEHSYWRDNLPKTPRHTVLGGLRNVFIGDEIAKVKAIAATYTSAFKEPMPRKAELKLDAVTAALDAGIERLRADAAQYLLVSGTQHAAMSKEAKKKVSEFLRSGASLQDQLTVIHAVYKWKMSEFSAVLEELATADSELSVEALLALEEIDRPRTQQQLRALLQARSEAVRAYAAGERAERADELDAWGEVAKILEGDDAALKEAVAAGLGRSGSKTAVPLLGDALQEGGGTSRAAAAGLAAIGGPEAVKMLKSAVVDGVPDARTASVLALTEVVGCDDCWRFLDEQYSKTSDDHVRQLIQAVTARPGVHK